MTHFESHKLHEKCDQIIAEIDETLSDCLLGQEIDRISNDERMTEAERWDDA